jgi:hypothetical protein
MEYSLRYPTVSWEPLVWEIRAGGQLLGSGHFGTDWDKARRTAKTHLRWQVDGEILAKVSTWCAGKLIRQLDRRRFAVWHWRVRGVEGVWRSSLPESTVPLIFGIVLAAVCPE